jgi:hypothetical protein
MLPGKTKYIVISLGVVIVAMFAILIFVPAARGPVVSTNSSSTDTGIIGSVISLDGHVEVGAPLADSLISSPARIAGNVTGGGWFFEGSFPVKVLDGDGRVLGQGLATTTGEWMSTGTVPFSTVIPFMTPRFTTGMIVLLKDNPSGLSQNAESLSIPVRFDAVSGGTGTVKGTVLLSPTCPVERIPPDPQCAPKPFLTIIGVSRNIETPTAFETAQSDASGSFQFVLQPGEYDFFHPQGAVAYPRCEEKVITVRAGETSDITISCDTGIR